MGQGRLMFRATLRRLRADEMSGRVVVFARASDFGDMMVGQPVRFTARVNRPARRDLTVAVLNASGRPTMGTAGAAQRAAHAVRGRFAAAARRPCPPAGPRCCPRWSSGTPRRWRPRPAATFARRA